ncbi:DNA-3-methyladenine glycosylase [Flavihumibacter petaseus]|uniref:Putative 3-methyladenine DNA glycosylase n=1 Tax=Flavihumibacter petaseus NBRC 106054 TaxID=1220578 RepID=A0A0E9MWX3_9BACT|nr:DNA-3-methyladenine glycosylase [Flavihumibacter petaseus]GAO41620.1 putative 3-methyladenine DNA glycosylase [Flavihumibacter petaseus NBRC 106054]
MLKLDDSFFLREDVLKIARELIGKILLTTFDGKRTSGRIVETEAYQGVIDRASHAYNNRRTARTEVMFGTGGVAYVYLCYGIHHLFNVVTSTSGQPHAVLIRAIEPVEGIRTILDRVRKKHWNASIGRGPGNVAKALGIHTGHTGHSLQDQISLWDDGARIRKSAIGSSVRIGVDYAGEDALLPYRFYLRGNPHVSGRTTLNR